MLAFFCSSLPNHHHVAFYLEVTIYPVNFPVIFATSNQALHLPLKRITSENKLIINIYPFVLSLPFNRVKSNFEQYIAYGGFPSWTHQQSPDAFICLLVIQLFGRGKRSKSHFNMADVCLCTEFCLLIAVPRCAGSLWEECIRCWSGRLFSRTKKKAIAWKHEKVISVRGKTLLARIETRSRIGKCLLAMKRLFLRWAPGRPKKLSLIDAT